MKELAPAAYLILVKLRGIHMYVGENTTIPRENQNPPNICTIIPHIDLLGVLLNASQNARIRKNLEASEVALKNPLLNNQVESKKLTLFRYGVT